MSTHAVTNLPSGTHEGILSNIHVGRAVGSGLIAGLGFAMLAMVYNALTGVGLWAPPRMVATILLGESAFGGTFLLVPVMLGMMLHLMLSAVYGIVFAAATTTLKTAGPRVIAGLVLGAAIYLVNFVIIAPALFPVFAESNQLFQIVNHMMFGLILGVSAYLLLKSTQR